MVTLDRRVWRIWANTPSVIIQFEQLVAITFHNELQNFSFSAVQAIETASDNSIRG